MTGLPLANLRMFAIFASLFSHPVFRNACLLFLGHILCKNRRTVAQLLRQLGLRTHLTH